MIKKIIRAIRQFSINAIIKLLSFFIKKDYEQWFFGMDGEPALHGNSFYFYDYLKKHHPEIKTFCIGNKKDLEKRLLPVDSKTIFDINSFKSIGAILKSGVCICSHEMASDAVNFSKHGTLKINLWHGVPIKKIQYASAKVMEKISNRPFMEKMKYFFYGYVPHEDYDLIVCTNDSYKTIMEEAFHNLNISLTGQPRDDIFYKRIEREQILRKYNLSSLEKMKIVTYLPTFRDSRAENTSYLFKGNQALLERLEKKNIAVVQKEHTPQPNQLLQRDDLFILTADIDTQELLYITDILITDYSSCYIDFLHTLRPVIFYPYDLDSYIQKDRELYHDYFDELITPGKKVKNEDQLCDAILCYAEDPKLDAGVRQKSLHYFHHYSDGKSCERVFQAITALMKKKNLISTFKDSKIVLESALHGNLDS